MDFSEVRVATLRQRARLLDCIRQWFAQHQILEVETPVLSLAGNSDPGLEQFSTADQRWLRTSPEYPMKRLLAAGSGDIYELGRVFRLGESGRLHNPEFTLLEWYRLGRNFEHLATEVTDLVNHCGERFGRQWVVRRVRYRDWLIKQAGVDPVTSSKEELANRAAQAGISLEGHWEPDRDEWLDLLISHCVQPEMDDRNLTVVTHYPISQAALARQHEADPRFAERFEIFLGKVELANGYGELTDPEEQRRRFTQEQEKRCSRGAAVKPLDENLLSALKRGLPECSGVALGVDRLLMALTGATSLEEVLTIPWNTA